MVLPYKKSQERFIKFGECDHIEDYFQDVKIPNSKTSLLECSICKKRIETFYTPRTLSDKILEYLSYGKKTRKKIYFRFREHNTPTVRGRLSELRKTKQIKIIGENSFVSMEVKQ